MSVRLSKIRAFYVGAEAQSSFGTAAETLIHLRCDEVDGQLEQTALANEFARQGDYDTAKIVGARRGTVVTKHKIHGFLASLPTAEPTALPEFPSATGFDVLCAALASAIGAIHAGGYAAGADAIDVTGGASPATVTVADGSDGLASFDVGQAVVWPTGVTRRAYEMGFIKAITAGADPDVGTLLQYPRRPVANADVLYGARTIFVRDLTPYHDDDYGSFTLKLVGHGSDDVYLCTGCQPVGVKISLKVNEPGMIEITWGVGDWTMPGSGGGPAVLDWDFPEPEVVLDWQVAVGSGSGVAYPTVKELELDLGITKVALEGGHSASGVEGWLATARRPKLTMSMHFDAGLVSQFQSQASFPISVQYGTQPGRMFGFVLPAARFGELPKRGDRDGATILDVTAEAHYYAGDTGGSSTTPANSLLRLAFA